MACNSSCGCFVLTRAHAAPGAPDCNPSDDGGIPDDALEDCEDQRTGLRNVILVCCMWLSGTIICFAISWCTRSPHCAILPDVLIAHDPLRYLAARIVNPSAPWSTCSCSRVELRPMSSSSRVKLTGRQSTPVSLASADPMHEGNIEQALLDDDHLLDDKRHGTVE